MDPVETGEKVLIIHTQSKKGYPLSKCYIMLGNFNNFAKFRARNVFIISPLQHAFYHSNYGKTSRIMKEKIESIYINLENLKTNNFSLDM